MKPKSYKLIIIILTLIILTIISIIGIALYENSQNDYFKKGDIVTTGNSTRPIEKLKSLVLLKGDTIAYNELNIAYLEEEYEEEYLTYSLFMANKYNYPPAYFYVYHCLTSIYENHRTGKIDKETKSLALKYLSKGVELGDINSILQMSELYINGKYVHKDINLGKKLLKRIQK
ncbi:hypothetical protein [uncultured Bacteroides sp.]|uniref:hypothetical protein n=1 Tax=uncultured Bacteroides sp. TaxID=162156 RepID=UPI002AAA9FD3|nr:hypothetical protein [uncultured Bacteroides sp.]